VAVVAVAAVSVLVAAVAAVAANVVAVLGFAAPAAGVAFVVPQGSPGGCLRRGCGENSVAGRQPAWDFVISRERHRSPFHGSAGTNCGEIHSLKLKI
jgi:hypothetical protein